MEKVNYIIQLNTILETFHNDERIKQGHITLYLAFFQLWNRKFFKKTLTINRESIMERAKIKTKTKTTYHNYLRDFIEWKYLRYYPSYHPARGSKIKMFKFGTSPSTQKVQNLDKPVPKPRQNLVPSYKLKTNENLNKQPKVIFNELEVLVFFKENNWSEEEGRKFCAYIQSQKWQTKENWKKAAKLFARNGFKMPNIVSTSSISSYVDRMKQMREN